MEEQSQRIDAAGAHSSWSIIDRNSWALMNGKASLFRAGGANVRPSLRIIAIDQQPTAISEAQ